jgi:hypothetical protein
LIDIDPAAGTEQFRYVISRTATPASKVLIKVRKFLSVKMYRGCTPNISTKMLNLVVVVVVVVVVVAAVAVVVGWRQWL